MTAADPSPSSPMACGQPYDVTRSVGHQLVGVMIQMRREAEARMAPHGLTDAQWKPLWAIQTGRASTANELARSMDIDASAVTRLLDRLEAKGLIERVRSAEDRRVVRLRLTPTGQEVTQVIPQVLATVNRDFLQGFAEAEIDQLRGFLTRMAANGAALPLAKNEAVTP